MPVGNTSEAGKHLVILAHGFQASASMLQPLGRAFAKRGVDVHVCSCNSLWFGTWDGIEAGGTRIADEVRHLLSERSRITFVGHSVGGLYLRYAIYLLDKELSEVPFDVCTIATPHRGASIPLAFLAANILGGTVKELAMKDLPDPILIRLASPPIIDSLQKCTKAIFVGNLNRDVHVPGETALAASVGSLPDAQPGLHHIELQVWSEDGPWIALERLPNLERLGMLWPKHVPSSHDIAAGHLGPLHFVRPNGLVDTGTLASKIVDILMGASRL